MPPRIGRYEIETEIGRGSMGVVYMAHDPHVRRRVALKTFVLPGGLTPEEETAFTERFLREAHAAGVLSHPGIVTIFDADTDAERGVSFIALEYVEGQSLRQILAEEGRLPPQKAIAMMESLSEALQAAHDAGIIHRDLKPANILVRARDGVPKITDFGVARLSTSDLTGAGDVFGSPAYMSPEQFQGATADARSDLFSLATILYQALSGERPFAGQELSSLAYSVVHTPARPISALLPEAPRELDRFFDRALAKDPAERFPDARSFKRALGGLSRGRWLPGAASEGERVSLVEATIPLDSTGGGGSPQRSASIPPSRLEARPGGISALEGALAAAMLALALIPGVWALWGDRRVHAPPKSESISAKDAAMSTSGDAETRGLSRGGAARTGSSARLRGSGASRRLQEPSSDMAPGSGSMTKRPDADSRSARSSNVPVGTSGPGSTAMPSMAARERSASGDLSSRRMVRDRKGAATGESGLETGASPLDRRAGGTRPAGVSGAASGPATSIPAASRGKPSGPSSARSDSVSARTGSGSPKDAYSITDPASGSQAAPAGSSTPLELASNTPVESIDATGSHLVLVAKSSVKTGTLRLLVDGQEVYVRHLSTETPEDDAVLKKRWYGRRQERFAARIPIAPGRHKIIARVVPEGARVGFEDRATVEIAPNTSFSLELVAGRVIGSPVSLKPQD